MPQAQGLLRHHRAFCRIGLPASTPPKPSWQRSAGTDVIGIEGAEAGPPLPSGKFLRLILMHIFSVAIRDESPIVKLGENATDLAAAIDPDITGPLVAELTEQLFRLLSARVTLGTEGGPALSLFDARGRARADSQEWRPTIRLNARFHANLAQNSVQLDRKVVTTLEDSILALDAYAFFAAVRPTEITGTPVQHAWDDLHARFAIVTQSVEDFRSSFEQALLLVCGADPTLGFSTNEHLVTVRTVPARPSAPVQMPAPVAVEVPPPARIAEAVEPPRRATERPPERAVERPPERPPERQPDRAPQVAAASQNHMPRDRFSLKHDQTGLSQVIWLVRCTGQDDVSIEVTPGRRYDLDQLTVLALEPMVLQIRGGLNAGEFERVSAWAAVNRDLIDDFWDGELNAEDEIAARVKKVPAPGWR